MTTLDLKKIEPEENEGYEYFANKSGAHIRVGPKGYAVGSHYPAVGPSIENMSIRPSDIFVASFPRSGTTWTQELVWLLVNDLDFETAKSIYISERYPTIELSMSLAPNVKERIRQSLGNDDQKLKALEFLAKPGPEIMGEMTSQRFIKTHLPLSLLPRDALDTANIVYIARDPRDVIVSNFYLYTNSDDERTEDDFRKYFEFFVKNLGIYTPYFEHVKEAWQQRHHPNMLFLFYENLIKDLPATVNRVSRFLGKRYDEDQLEKLYDHLSFDNFKKNKFVDLKDMRDLGVWPERRQHIRKGKSGGWRDYFDDELRARCDRWMADNLQDTGLVFPSV